ncbi:MAG: dienelactone hydrolase family protein [Candidatus Promineofilum sp.]|nr:dienelactone hydrolase family protein [Promineifilum sp.]
MTTHANPHENGPLSAAGQPLETATGALILLHGRGATAESILELAAWLPHPGLAYLAPQADDFTWYPYSFMMPAARNEPYLSAALARVAAVVAQVEAAGIPAERLIMAGFSQGACLASEFIARHARRYGGLLTLSGGLIGPPGTPRDYTGSLAGTPVFIGCSDRDPHIPVERVRETADVLARLGGQVDSRIYPGLGHTINQDELEAAAALVAAAMGA